MILIDELHEHAYLHGLKFFLWFLKNGDIIHNFTMLSFCVSSNSIASPSFRSWSIPVSEIRKFNQKKKMNNSI